MPGFVLNLEIRDLVESIEHIELSVCEPRASTSFEVDDERRISAWGRLKEGQE